MTIQKWNAQHPIRGYATKDYLTVFIEPITEEFG